jgi:hypothetical protein
MEGGPSGRSAGMIPRAVEQVFRVAEEMKAKGWDYVMEGQFLEIVRFFPFRGLLVLTEITVQRDHK